MGDNHDGDKDMESWSGSEKENVDKKVDTIMLGNHIPAIESLPLTINDEMQMIFLRLVLSQTVAQKQVED